jgi:hypothetical protein
MLYHQIGGRGRSTKSACSAGCGKLAQALAPRPLYTTQFFLQIVRKKRADERTRTSDLLITSALLRMSLYAALSGEGA